MRIDAHQHFWIYNKDEHVWMTDEHAAIKKSFLPNALSDPLSEEGFDGSVVVQARQSLDETEWLLSLAEENEFIKGVVGWVDLCSDEVEKQLQKYAKNSYFKGVRHVVHDEQDDRFMLREDFRKGISLLEHYQLTYDFLLFPKHLPIALELVKEFPRQKFVLDHIGKPNIGEHLISPWKEDLYNLAKHPNVYCKLSGMVTEANKNWNYEDFIEYLDVVFDAFGPKRLMIGSDWPVSTLCGSYADVIGIVRRYIASLSDEDQSLIEGNTCAAFYGIE
ncbi:amidohydrolase family protein [Radiobacillus sp. PE A8.2]|uniref:amidohydrolase family protein n=1 Tax=Radiobacillus sp. PE A8.2 TaxID=3380349 RepID=UPI00388F7828